MQLLMQKLHLEIPSFKLVRRLKISRGREIVKNKEKEFFYFQGVDSNDAPYTLFPSIEVSKGTEMLELKKEPMKYYQDRLQVNYTVKVHFQGHYAEPTVDIRLDGNSIGEDSYKLFIMTYDPNARVWESVADI